MLAFLSWWVLIQIFGLAALPLVQRVFTFLPDRGYAFSKAAGLLLVSYILWIGASAGLLINDTGGIALAFFIVTVLSIWAAWRTGAEPLTRRLRAFWNSQRSQIMLVEALFLLAFAAWALVRAYAPDKILPSGGEKYMEMAFLNGVLNSPRFPPLDPWMSGHAISYYYFGYVMMSLIVRASGVAASVGFDLYDALLFALTAVSAYGVVSNLVRSGGGSQRAAGGFGLLGALFTVGMGNLQGLIEALYSSRALPEAFFSWLNIPGLAGAAQTGSFYPGHGWWWWRASRVLQDLDLFYQPVIYQPIDEFPFFSFLLGDNHPHKLALPFVLLVVGLAFNQFLRARQPAGELPVRVWLRGEEMGPFLFTALALGALAFLNTWDFPVLLGLIILARALGSWQRPPAAASPIRSWLPENLLYSAALGALSVLLYFFFYLSFSSQAGGVLPYVFPPTRLPQYLVMFGPFVLILSIFGYMAARRAAPARGVLRAWLWLAGPLLGLFLLALLAGMLTLSLPGSADLAIVRDWLGDDLNLSQALLRIVQVKAANPWLFLLLSTQLALVVSALWYTVFPRSTSAPAREPLSPAAQFALLLALAGLGLTLIVEFFYLRDNFGMRMNTIFKFYFQGWVLMACASAFAFWWIMRRAGTGARSAFAFIASLLIAAGMLYPLMGIASRTEGFSRTPTLDAAASFAGFYPGHWAAQPDDYAAIQWLVQNGRLPDGSPPTILEAGSTSYENAGRISAFTGFPSLLGWTNHEGQWRGSREQINRRAPVIASIYTTPSAQTALELLREWQVDYLILGGAERIYITGICRQPETACQPNRALEKFEQVLEPVFSQGGTTVYRVPQALGP